MGEDCIGARIRLHCVFTIGNQSFAIVENERTEIVTIVRISPAILEFLRLIGVRVCNVVG